MTKVLVIDDCEEIRDITAEILRDAGYDVGVAANSEGGLSALATEEFDAVLCDLVLPLVNDAESEDHDSAMVGAHCIHEITRRYPKVAVIAISGQLVGSPLSTLRQFGARATLSKPFAREELLGALETALR